MPTSQMPYPPEFRRRMVELVRLWVWKTKAKAARIESKTVKLDLSSAGVFPKLTVREYIAMPESAERPFYSVQGAAPTWTDLFSEPESDIWRRAGDAVGMVVGGRQTKTWCCSGVIVSRRPQVLFLTNFHCGAPDPALADSAFWSDEVCASTVVDFSWDGDKVSREFSCEKVVAADPKRDLVVLQLKPLSDRPVPPPPPLRWVSEVDPIDDLVILHHPQCASKKVSKGCSISDRAVNGWRPDSGKSDFTHRCDTESGSSGAPMFDGQARLIGIHHLGFEVKDGQCDRLNKAVWLCEAAPVLKQAGLPLTPHLACPSPSQPH